MEEKEHKGKETNRERFGTNASPILYSGFRYSSFTRATRSIDIHFRLTIAARVYLSMQTRRLKIRNIRMPVCNVAVTEKRFITAISSRGKINANRIPVEFSRWIAERQGCAYSYSKMEFRGSKTRLLNVLIKIRIANAVISGR